MSMSSGETTTIPLLQSQSMCKWSGLPSTPLLQGYVCDSDLSEAAFYSPLSSTISSSGIDTWPTGTHKSQCCQSDTTFLASLEPATTQNLRIKSAQKTESQEVETESWWHWIESLNWSYLKPVLPPDCSVMSQNSPILFTLVGFHIV